MPSDKQAQYLFLEESDEFRGYWEVDSLYPDYFFDYEELLGPWRLLAPDKLLDFLAFSEAHGYYPVFDTEPLHLLNATERLHDQPNVTIHSTMDKTTNGFLSWQIVGYNKLIRDESIRTGYFVWTVGSGKTVMIAAAILFHQQHGHPFQLAFVTVKSHNKIDTQRKLKQFADIDSVIIDGSREKRWQIYSEIATSIYDKKQPVVAITNYEKFREDKEALNALFKGLDMLFFWDEAPRKLSNRATQLYRAVKRALYIKFTSQPRPNWQRHWILSATPIENSPEDPFSVINITWPRLLGTVSDFHNQYVQTYNFFSGKPESWRDLDHLAARIAFMTHRVSRDDPEIAEMFPERIPAPQIIDWASRHRELYDKLTKKATDLFDEEASSSILSIIQVMQMICDAPSMVVESAKNRERFNAMMEGVLEDQSGPIGSDIAFQMVQKLGPESFKDRGHTKLEMWKEIMLEKHPDEKIVTFSTWADYIFPIWEHWLQEWGISYTIYAGPKKQEALDRFRDDPNIRVLLSGDSGSDSVDITEARVGINYNVPWKWTTLEQRVGRRDRVSSGFNTIVTYDLMMANSIDERKQAICEKKRSYHETVYDGQVKDMDSAKITRADLYYVLTGEDLT